LGRRFGKNIARRLIQKFENYRLPDGLSAGDICSIESGSGGFGIVKILALEPGTVHIRLYKEKFASRPNLIDATGVSPEELEGYNLWKESGGGVWG
jgi:hypothetical protein